MEKFTIITNSVKDKNQSVAQRIADYLANHKKECVILEAEEKRRESALPLYGCIADS